MVWGRVYGVTAFSVYSTITYTGFKYGDSDSLALAIPVALLWPFFTPVAAALAVDYYQYSHSQNKKK